MPFVLGVVGGNKNYEKKEKKAELDPNPNLTLRSPVTHNDDLHCLYEGKLLGEFEAS